MAVAKTHPIKSTLKAAIDRLIPTSSIPEDLLARLQLEGYEIKRGMYISARVPDASGGRPLRI